MSYASLLLMVIGCATLPPAQQPLTSIADLERSVRELGEAWAAGDPAGADRLLAKSYVHTDVTGSVLERAAWLEQIRTRGTRWTIELDELQMVPFASGAIATGRNRITSPDGKRAELRFTQLWVREGTGWQRRAFAAALVTPKPDRADSSTAEAEVRAAATAWAEAIQRRDVPTAELILADEYSLTAPGLGEMPRAKWIAALPDYVVHSYEFTDVKVNVYGDSAVMQSQYKQSATVFGKDRSGAMRVTDVWVKRDGRWKVVARHTSFL